MKSILSALLIGAAVAGLIYYFRDNENVKKALGKAKDAATDALSKANWNKTGKRVAGAVAEHA